MTRASDAASRAVAIPVVRPSNTTVMATPIEQIALFKGYG